MKAKPPNFTLAGREHIALAADNVRLPTKRVATGPRQADHGPSGPENPGNVGSKAQTSGECRLRSPGMKEEQSTNPSVKYVTSRFSNPSVSLGSTSLLCYLFAARISNVGNL